MITRTRARTEIGLDKYPRVSFSHPHPDYRDITHTKMHHLFSLVLSGKDLSQAGELFSLSDTAIMNDLSEVICKVQEITSSYRYVQNDNDQSVVEICIARVTSTIRDADCIEDHISALVDLLKTCLNHDLKPLSKDVDPPHAKIASDVLACIFLNYAKRSVMKQALPVAVKFLHKGNNELSRNVSSYLPLAAIEHPDLLAEHIQPIIDSVIGGNYNLTRILPQIYSLNQERINEHIMALANLLHACDDFEKSCLLNLFKLVAASNSSSAAQLLEPSLPQLLDCLKNSSTVVPTLEVFLEMSSSSRLIQDHMDAIKKCVTSGPAFCVPAASITAAEVFSRIGINNRGKSIQSLNNMVLLLQSNVTDQSVQTQILREILSLCNSNPDLLNKEIIEKISKYTHISSSSGVGRIFIDKLWDLSSRRKNNITIVKINQHPQASTATSSSSELLSKQPVANGSSSSLLHMNSGSSSLVRCYPSINQSTLMYEGSKHRTVGNNIVANSLTRLNAGIPVKQPYVASPTHNYYYQPQSLTQQSNYGSSNASQHKSLTRLNLNVSGNSIATLAKKRTTPTSSYQNRSVCSISGLKEDQNYITTVPSSPLNSLSSIPTNGLPTTLGVSSGNTHNNASHSSSNWATITSPQLQSHSILQNYFLGNSTASILSNAANNNNINSNSNYTGSRMLSTTHISQANNTGLYSKGLINPTTPVTNQSATNHSFPIQQQYHQHQSQPDLRNNNNGNYDNNTSVTFIQQDDSARISVFEPYPMRDTVQHFCEKHLDVIRSYMEKISVRIPLPVKCTIEERKSKKNAKLHFACHFHTDHCVYTNHHLFAMKTRSPRAWIHIMFLALQARSPSALSTRETSVSSLKNCWDTLKSENKSFLTLVTSAFPSSRDQDALLLELRNSGFFDLFEFNAIKSQWGCFLCSHPDRALEFLSSEEPIIEGCLKEKKGKWRLFKRWKTRYFTLSGGQLHARGNDSSSSTLNLHQILSVRVTRGHRNIPKAFEIFTQDKSFVLKPKDGKNANEWVQCLSVLVARKDGGGSQGQYHKQQLGKGISLNGLRTAV